MSNNKRTVLAEPRTVVFLEMELNDTIIQEVKLSDEPDERLMDYITKYKKGLEEQGVQIYESGFTYLVCEDFICIAAYENELEK